VSVRGAAFLGIGVMVGARLSVVALCVGQLRLDRQMDVAVDVLGTDAVNDPVGFQDCQNLRLDPRQALPRAIRRRVSVEISLSPRAGTPSMRVYMPSIRWRRRESD
jgi:hypothetical protein